MPQEKIGETVGVFTAPHPDRADSAQFRRTRQWLMRQTRGGCFICGGPVDMSHPELPADAKGLEDHHGGGIFVGDVLVGFNLFPLEWSMGWGADPRKVQAFVAQLVAAGLCSYTKPIRTTEDVMDWVDSKWNAVKLCRLCRIRHKPHYADYGIMPRSRWRPEEAGFADAA